MFSRAIEKALRVALEAHDGQWRKGFGQIPYVAHPFHVALLLARWNHDDAVIQAALLHDVVEDCDEWTLDRINQEFGARVAGIVAELTEDKSLSWDERKHLAVAHVPRLSPDAAAVKCMDKQHNLESLLGDLQRADDPADVWKRFRGGRDKTMAHAEQLVDALELRVDPRMARALRKTFDELQEHVAASKS